MKDPLPIPTFATAQLALLSAELAAEKASTELLLSSASPMTLARAGLAILNLSLSSQQTGLGGKTVLDFEPDSSLGASELGEHDVRVGDIVRVGPQPKGNERKREKADLEGKGVEGVVTRVSVKSVCVAVEREESEDRLGGRVWV